MSLQTQSRARVRSTSVLLLAIAMTCVSKSVDAQNESITETKTSLNVKVQTIIDGLDRPCGVAIHPVTGDIFVSEAGKVIRIAAGSKQTVLEGFSVGNQTNEFPFNSGPLALAFLDPSRLIVGTGSQNPDGIMVYEIQPSQELPVDGENPGSHGTLPAESELVAGTGFSSLAVSPIGIYSTALGDSQHEWIARWEIENGNLKKLKRFINTQEASQTSTPAAVTISPDGFVTVGLMGKLQNEPDSLLAFFDEASGNLQASFATGLRDITALSYSPKARRLFALDYSFAEPDAAGLFKLVGRENNTKCEAVEILRLKRPTAMAFDSAGNLYVCLLGDKADGQLIKVTGIDVAVQSAADEASKNQ